MELVLDNTYGKIWGVDFARKYKEGQTAAVDNLRIETRSRKKASLVVVLVGVLKRQRIWFRGQGVMDSVNYSIMKG